MKKSSYIKPITNVYPLLDKVMEAGTSNNLSVEDLEYGGDPNERPNSNAGW
jgi:hypothetical protein